MADAAPEPRYASGDPEEGRAAAGVVWLLYLLGLIGVVHGRTP